jgi:hypothetical protein
MISGQEAASCVPQNAELEIGRDTLQEISKVLYRKIHDKVGSNDQQIKAIMDNHSIECDGYKTLHDIMRHFQQPLQDIPMLWRPTWGLSRLLLVFFFYLIGNSVFFL